MVDEPLITKYRPRDWGEVIGHEETIASLSRALATSTHPHAFLFFGPSGVGKTTMARIIAKHINAEVVELDAATHTGVDAMRELVELGQHRPLSNAGNRLIILDEAHMLSRSSFNAILKMLEEPPSHLYIALCTTELQRIPETVQTRLFKVKLETLPEPQIQELIEEVAYTEGWDIPNWAFQEIVLAATGQPRKALTLLQGVAGAKTREEVKRIINLIDAEEPIKELCRLMIEGKVGWDKVQPVLTAIGDNEFETAQLMVGGYFAAVMMNAATERQARRAWTFLEALTYPTNTFDRKVAFLTAIGRTLWAEQAQ
jgi:DNA polymerase-3 subunit gamma/tau